MPKVLIVLVALLVAGAPLRAAELSVRGDLAGKVEHYKARQSDTLLDVARRFDLGYVELIATNPEVDPWLPKKGTDLVLPTAHLLPNVPRRGIVINLAEMRLYYFSGDERVVTHPVGIGKQGDTTPTGETKVVRKRTDPTWCPPESIRKENPDLPKCMPPGPNNPLGKYALDLAWPSYLIHGTNRPWGVGRRVSHGCIRLYPEDIGTLYPRVSVGTPVRMIDDPVKVGWSDGELYLEVHPSPRQADQLEATGRFDLEGVPGLVRKVITVAGDRTDRIDWRAIRQAAVARSGMPIRITRTDGAPLLTD